MRLYNNGQTAENVSPDLYLYSLHFLHENSLHLICPPKRMELLPASRSFKEAISYKTTPSFDNQLIS